MKGIVFTEFLEMVEETFGDELLDVLQVARAEHWGCRRRGRGGRRCVGRHEVLPAAERRASAPRETTSAIRGPMASRGSTSVAASNSATARGIP